jgi:hypothetical protein
MTMPAGGEIFQYTFIQNLPATIMETVIHFRARTLAAITNAQHIAVADNWLASVARCQSNRVLYSQFRVKQMTPLGFDQLLLIPTYGAGNVNEDPANNQLAIVFTKRTGVAGLRHRGRMYVGGFPITGGVQGLVGGSLTAAVGATAGELLAKFGEDGTDPTMCAGVYSKEIGGSLPFTLAGWQPITKWDPQLLFGVQRKRKIGVGI